jgi:alpha-methylacyl-CoA racemase
MGGGGLLLAFGLVSAVLEARLSGVGQVVDAAMFEGAALLGTAVHTLIAMGLYDPARPGSHFGDTGSHFYDVYQTKDGRYMAVGAIEPQFYARLVEGLGLDPASLPKQMDKARWPEMKRRFAQVFTTRTSAEWEEVFRGIDACVSPVLSPSEAAKHPHAVARGSFSDESGFTQVAPAPRFSRTPTSIAHQPPAAQEGEATLRRWGVEPDSLTKLREQGVLA